jgi:hypothetical protein
LMKSVELLSERDLFNRRSRDIAPAVLNPWLPSIAPFGAMILPWSSIFSLMLLKSLYTFSFCAFCG